MTEQRDTLMDALGRRLADNLRKPVSGAPPYTHANVAALRRTLRPGDILLVEGASAYRCGHQIPHPVHLVARRALRRERPDRLGMGPTQHTR